MGTLAIKDQVMPDSCPFEPQFAISWEGNFNKIEIDGHEWIRSETQYLILLLEHHNLIRCINAFLVTSLSFVGR